MWQSYKQEGGCLVHFVRLATTLLKDEGSARYACHTIRDAILMCPRKPT